MNQERQKQAINLLNQYAEKNEPREIIGYSSDPTSKDEANGFVLNGLARDSGTVEELESLGFKVIYPAKIKEGEIGRWGLETKKINKIFGNNALVIDGEEKHLSLDFANMIAKHYFSCGYSISGVNIQNNSITEYPHGNFEEGANIEFQNLLNDLGFKTQMTEYGNVTVSSDIPYPAVKKSKFEQIYDKAKGKIQGAFAKLKSFVTSKEQVKENDTNERE